jgi:hypothetical protein
LGRIQYAQHGHKDGLMGIAHRYEEGMELSVRAKYTSRNYIPGATGSGRRLLAFVLNRDKDVTCVELGDAGRVDAAVSRWRYSLLDGRMEWLANRYAADLCEQIWKPLEPHLAGARTVIVGPDASLARMPLAALPGRRADSFLIEDIAIGYVTSGRDVVNMFSQPARDSGQGLLAIGGIRYEAEPGLAKATEVVREGRPLLDESDRGHISFLPGTEMEARRCRELFQQAFPKERATLLVGAEPSEARVKQEFDGRYATSIWRHTASSNHLALSPP